MKRPDELTILAYLDDELPADERAAVEAWLASDPEGRRLVDEHRAVWAFVGEALDAPPAAPSDTFRRETVERARREPAPVSRLPVKRWAAAVAAAVMMALGLWAWQGVERAPDSPFVVDDATRPIIGHLELLDHLEFLRQHGDELDLATDYMILRTFENERGLAR